MPAQADTGRHRQTQPQRHTQTDTQTDTLTLTCTHVHTHTHAHTRTNKQASTTAQRNRHKECERKGETTPHRKRMPPAAKKPKVKAIKDEKGEEMCSDLCVGVWNVWVWNV